MYSPLKISPLYSALGKYPFVANPGNLGNPAVFQDAVQRGDRCCRELDALQFGAEHILRPVLAL
jgi:hypothetical protein